MSKGKNSVFGIATGVALSQGLPGFMKTFRRWSFRFRRVLTPVWTAFLVYLVAVVWRWQIPQWWPVVLVLPLLGVGLAWGGPHLSERWSRVVMKLVPDGLDKGQDGILDRLTERLYLAILLSYTGAYLAVRIVGGASYVSGLLWQIGLGAFGVTYWYHRRVRSLGKANKYVKKWARFADRETCPPTLISLVGSKVVKHDVSPNGKAITLTIKLAEGVTADRIGHMAESLDSYFNLRKGATTITEYKDQSRYAVAKFVPKDPWEDKIEHPLPGPDKISLASSGGRFSMGIYANSDELIYQLQHTLLCGTNGSGKSGWLHSLIAWLVPCRDVVLLGIDMAQGATLNVWRKTFALPIATDVDSALIILEKVFAVIKYREGVLSKASEEDDDAADSFVPSKKTPWIVLIIEEFPDLLAEAKNTERYDSKGNVIGNMYDLLVLLLGRIAKKARKCGIRLVFATQNGTKVDTGSKEMQGQLKATVGLRLDQNQSKNLWGGGSFAGPGWNSTDLGLGEFLLRDEDHSVPDKAKGYWVDNAARRKMVSDNVGPSGTREVYLEPDAWSLLMSETMGLDVEADVPEAERTEADDRRDRVVRYLEDHWTEYRNGVKAQTISDDLEIPTSTLYRDLDVLRSDDPGPCRVQVLKKWYYPAGKAPTESGPAPVMASIQGEQTGG